MATRRHYKQRKNKRCHSDARDDVTTSMIQKEFSSETNILLQDI